MDDDFVERLEARNPDVLYEIKKLLRSRCPETMLTAVNAVESCLQQEPLAKSCPLREFLLEEDMVGFLCDAMATNSWHLLERLTYVLELLSDSDKMLLEGHAVVAVEAAQRRAHFLGLMVSSTSTECEAALRTILRLMSTLLERWRSVQGPAQCVSNLCPPQGLLSTLRLVLDARCTSASTTLGAAHMLCSLLRFVSVGGEPGDPTSLAVSVATCVRSASGSLLRLLQQDDAAEEQDRKGVVEEACQSLCGIAALVTRVRSDCDERRDADCDDALRIVEDLEAEVQRVMVDKCLPVVVAAARAAIEQADNRDILDSFVEDSDEEGAVQPGMTWALLDALQTCLDAGKDAAALADTLACQDFLWLLPVLHRVEGGGGSASPLRLLCSVLAHLAVDLLDAAAWWPAGVADLACFLSSGVAVLPGAEWLWAQTLEEWGYLPLALAPSVGPRVAAHLLVLLLAYFRAVVGGDSDWEGQAVLATSLPAYVLSLPGGGATQQASQRVPASLLKMVWVSFAVNCVLASDTMTPAASAASARLAQLLADMEARGVLASAFTPHPCLLYWAFQAKAVSPRVQQAVLELWLAQSEAGDAAAAAPVLEIVQEQPQAVHPLLDVVTSAPQQAAATAARILQQAATARPAVALDLAAGLWGRLPLSLSRCGGGLSGGRAQDVVADGCGLLVWLAAEVYQPPPGDMALRVANLLGGVLGRQRLAAPRHRAAAMFILRKLLEDSRGRSDPRVHATLLSDARFAQAVLSAAGSDADVQVCAAALGLLRHLEDDNALLKAPVVLTATPLDVGTLMLAVSSADLQVAEAGVALLLQVLKPKTHPFLTLEADEELTRSLYFLLQNLVLKVRGAPAARDAVWRALDALLQRQPALCQQPWNHVLLKLNVKKAPMDQLGADFFSFVLQWLRQVAPAESPEPTPRRTLPTMLTETCIEIAAALAESDLVFQKRAIVRDIADALLRVTANLPSKLESRMKEVAGK